MTYTLPFDPYHSQSPCGDILAYLHAHSEADFGDFQAKLMPTLTRDTILGVRTPILRKLAKALYGTPMAEVFLSALPHAYFEENNLHGFIISESRTFDEAMTKLNTFLPYVDNWATCDQMSPKVLGKDLSRLERHIGIWLSSSHIYTVRYGMGMLMRYYLGEQFKPCYPNMVAEVLGLSSLKDYYINMMGAWYFATALAFNYDEVLPYIKGQKLPLFVHNKTIQKAVESYRISEAHKAELKTYRIRA